MYLLAILFPPLAIYLCGKPVQALIAVPLCCLGWLPSAIWAMSIVAEYNAEGRNKKLIRALGSRDSSPDSTGQQPQNDNPFNFG